MTTIFFLLCFMTAAPQDAQPAAQDPPYEVVLVNDKVLKIKEPPLFDGRLAHLVLLNGQKSTFPTKMIDQQKTLERNRRLAITREAAAFAAEQKAEEAAAKAEAAPTPEEEKERGPIVLTSTRDLPDTSNRDVINRSDDTGAVAEDTGETKERRFTSNEDAFVSHERMTKLASGYKIDAEVSVNQPLGVDNVMVKLTATFEDDTLFEESKSLGKMGYGQKKSARFNLRNSEDIKTISYQVRYVTTRVR